MSILGLQLFTIYVHDLDEEIKNAVHLVSLIIIHPHVARGNCSSLFTCYLCAFQEVPLRNSSSPPNSTGSTVESEPWDIPLSVPSTNKGRKTFSGFKKAKPYSFLKHHKSGSFMLPPFNRRKPDKVKRRREMRAKDDHLKLEEPQIEEVSKQEPPDPIAETSVLSPVHGAEDATTASIFLKHLSQEPLVQQSLIQQPLTPDPLTPDARVQQPLTVEARVQQPLTVEARVQQPLTVEARVQQPLTVEARFRSPSLWRPAFSSPSLWSPAFSSPSLWSPAFSSPSLWRSAFSSPSLGSPAFSSPSLGSPAFSSPSLGSPAFSSPSLGPRVQQPLTLEPRVQQPLTVEPRVQQSLTPETRVQQPLTPEPLTPETRVQQPLTPETHVQQSLTPETRVQQSLTPETRVQQSLTPEARVQQSLTPEAHVQQPLTVEARVQQPLTVEARVQQPLTVEPLVQQPLVPQPLTESPCTGQDSSSMPATAANVMNETIKCEKVERQRTVFRQGKQVVFRDVDTTGNDEDIMVDSDDDSWDLVTCYCMKPFAGRPMIECNECGTWIHLSCAKIRKSNVPEVYVCQRCRDSKYDIRRSNRSRISCRKHFLD
ncbi:LOW QUALITY PROTEIN: mediator of DNA damage checkpoint protein 1-like [Chiloscyllium plagiosum]|uniref:LOW QUALITY PROTEIN: mediator of DNA damage checkpoint protein 1-like n=1 Tax=Chiloscyllium plagiosum TaxID=36176 RepID=UPI001CB86F21|nr:LOW QUALITY PROTEIN: mediator of DNA damage checkpoint protein 1-like [Chiloscyllium plagiosum]